MLPGGLEQHPRGGLAAFAWPCEVGVVGAVVDGVDAAASLRHQLDDPVVEGPDEPLGDQAPVHDGLVGDNHGEEARLVEPAHRARGAGKELHYLGGPLVALVHVDGAIAIQEDGGPAHGITRRARSPLARRRCARR